ncbi:hypothetical protein CALVIDRAFT_49021 [Calocera viscosa TUFC12733]|uniref:Uncharacterized protein n=1 Tax=Calocera viscosa (strain TUFC12733) TaxID=1330018 RepID=A0A167NQQ8_CALVF|nr:hypothetical protein CALVIDRAFT_49021 [Calocera viscosa TUFC12733]
MQRDWTLDSHTHNGYFRKGNAVFQRDWCLPCANRLPPTCGLPRFRLVTALYAEQLVCCERIMLQLSTWSADQADFKKLPRLWHTISSTADHASKYLSGGSRSHASKSLCKQRPRSTACAVNPTMPILAMGPGSSGGVSQNSSSSGKQEASH